MRSNRKTRLPLPSALPPALLLPLLLACGPATIEAPAPSPGPPPAPSRTANDAAATAAAATITAAHVEQHVHALAHDSTRGRDTPSPELEKAATYLAHHFRALGLEPAGLDGTFLHRWDYGVVAMDRAATTFQVPGQTAPVPTVGVDYFMVPGPGPVTEARAYYVGVAGQATAVPAEARGHLVVFDLPVAELSQEWQMRLSAAIEPAGMVRPAGIVLILHPDFPAEMIAEVAAATAAQQAAFPIIGIAHEAARTVFHAAGGGLDAARAASAPGPLGDRPLEIRVERTRETHRPPNVVGVRRGSDPILRDTYLVITAHFDHSGVGAPDERGDSIFNGADDNASGTTALLEMARAFMALPEPPARSVVFLAVSGEEKGLLGSMAWVEDPTVPLDDIVANINMDMVGRNAPDTLIGIGQEHTNLAGVIQGIVDRHPELGLQVITDPEPEKMFFFRSDQLSFVQHGIPAVFFTTGDHEDYHRQSDLPGRIDHGKLARVARLGFHLAYEIAMDPGAPRWTDEGWREVQERLRQMGF
jgi:hypothetical protein